MLGYYATVICIILKYLNVYSALGHALLRADRACRESGVQGNLQIHLDPKLCVLKGLPFRGLFPKLGSLWLGVGSLHFFKIGAVHRLGNLGECHLNRQNSDFFELTDVI